MPVPQQFINLTKATSNLVIDSVRAIPHLTTLQLQSLAGKLSILLIPLWILLLGLASLAAATIIKLSQVLDVSFDTSAFAVGLVLITFSIMTFFILYRRISR